MLNTCVFDLMLVGIFVVLILSDLKLFGGASASPGKQNGVSISYRRSALQRGLRMSPDFTFDAVEADSVEICATLCASRTLCRSLNYLANNKLCELNVRSLLEYPSNKEHDPDSTYADKGLFERTDACSAHDCSSKEICFVDGNVPRCSMMYSVSCPANYTHVSHAELSFPCELAVGSTCKWSCIHNYKSMVSENSGHMMCLSSGDWLLNEPKCKLWIYDCQEWLSLGYNTSGIYNLTLGGVQMEGMCDMVTMGGGWTVLTSRYDGSVNFNRSWHDYKYGFGDVRGEFWIGNEYISALTWQRNYEIYFKLQKQNTGDWFYAHFNSFSVSPEEGGYPINNIRHRNFISGDAGQSLDKGDASYGTISNMKFSTFDKDQDLGGGNLARNIGGGWWYKYGAYAILTGRYGTWNYRWQYQIGSLRASSMMVRPNDRT